MIWRCGISDPSSTMDLSPEVGRTPATVQTVPNSGERWFLCYFLFSSLCLWTFTKNKQIKQIHGTEKVMACMLFLVI